MAEMLPLAYAQPVRAGPGLVLFRPSLRSAVLLLLAASAVAWVARRHEPWVVTCDGGWLEDNDPIRPSFTPDDLLVLEDDALRLWLYDPASGRRVIELYHFADYHHEFRPLHGGKEFLIFDADAPAGLVIDAHTGAVIRRVPNLLSMGLEIEGINDDASRVLTRGRILPGGQSQFTYRGGGDAPAHVWDLSKDEPPEKTLPLKQLGDEDNLHFTDLVAQGRLITLVNSETGVVLDARTLAPIRPLDASDDGCSAADWVGPYVVVRSRQPFATSTSAGTLELRDAITDEVRHRLPWSQSKGWEYYDLSDDHSRFLVLRFLSNNAQTIEEWDLATARQVGTTANLTALLRPFRRPLVSGGFIPRSREFFVWEAATGADAVYEEPGGWPVAYLRAGDGVTSFTAGRCSPDGRFMAAVQSEADLTNKLFVARRGPWECRPSRFGVLGMPHVWLLIVALAGAIASLAADARQRGRVAGAVPPRIVPAVLLGVGGAATLYGVLAACLWQEVAFLWPAPAAVVLGIGVAGGARLWRWAGVIGLAWVALWCGWLAGRTWWGGLGGSSLTWVLDRPFDVPRRLPAALAAAAAGLAVALAGALLAGLRRGGLVRTTPLP